jgi:hypothetical protein
VKHSLLFSAKQELANLFNQVGRADLPYRSIATWRRRFAVAFLTILPFHSTTMLNALLKFLSYFYFF